MAKRKDPAVLVVRYFQTAELSQAQFVLTLARDAVNQRKPKVEGAKVRGARKRVTPPPPPAPPLAGA